MGLNFRVVENSPPKYVDRFDDFVRLYNESALTVAGICKELDWSMNVYKQARVKALEEGLITQKSSYKVKSKKNFSPRFYSFSAVHNRFYIKKWIYDEVNDESELVYFGSYRSEDAVKMVVEELKKVDWDKDELDDIRSMVKERLGVSVL